MVTVLLWTMLSIFLACIAGLIVIGIHDYLAEDHPHRGQPDGFVAAVKEAWDARNTATGRIRLLLAGMASREAEEHGAQPEPAGLHRATP